MCNAVTCYSDVGHLYHPFCSPPPKKECKQVARQQDGLNLDVRLSRDSAFPISPTLLPMAVLLGSHLNKIGPDRADKLAKNGGLHPGYLNYFQSRKSTPDPCDGKLIGRA